MDEKLLEEFIGLFEKLNWRDKSPEDIDLDVEVILSAAVDVVLRPRDPPRPLFGKYPSPPPGLFGAWSVSKLSVHHRA
jgi:hypothetical protein